MTPSPGAAQSIPDRSTPPTHSPQTELAALSDNSVHLVVAGASHQSLLDNQADAAVSSQAITQVVDAARTGTPLK